MKTWDMERYEFRKWTFEIFELADAKNYLDQMAQKGLLLKDISEQSHLAAFEKTAPLADVEYCVDVFDDTAKDSQDFENYKRICEDAGWEYITSCDMMHFFKAESWKQLPPLHTDLETQYANIAEAARQKGSVTGIFLFGLACIAYCLFEVYANPSQEGLRGFFLSRPILLILPLFGLGCILKAIRNGIYLRTLKKVVCSGAAEIPSYRKSKFYRHAQQISGMNFSSMVLFLILVIICISQRWLTVTGLLVLAVWLLCLGLHFYFVRCSLIAPEEEMKKKISTLLVLLELASILFMAFFILVTGL